MLACMVVCMYVRMSGCMHVCVYASESYSVLSVTNVVNVSKVMWCDVM